MVTLEPVVFVVRAGPAHEKHGDPFTASGTLIVDGEEARLKGVTIDTVWQYREQFVEALRQRGVRVLSGHRIKDGRVRKVEVRVEC